MDQTTATDSFTVESTKHGPLPATVVRHADADDAPMVIFLYGGGGSEQTLVELAPLLSRGVETNSIPPMTVGCLGVPPWCFYLDDAERGWGWETAVAEDFPSALAQRYPSRNRPALLGISMGGHAALRIAFDRPEQFGAVAAVAPMIEPSTDPEGSPLRNRFHYPPDCPQPLVGPRRDPELYRRHHPAVRASVNAEKLRASGLPIWLDAGSRDAVRAHDGAESLHRTLWDLDVLHEYHLLRDAGHVGPSLPDRLTQAFSWLCRRIALRDEPLSAEQNTLRDALALAEEAASRQDPTLQRHYGRL
jgi:S-formylglutathione hydrolase